MVLYPSNASPQASSSVMGSWQNIGTASCVVWVDSAGNYYVKDTGIGPTLGELIVDSNVVTPYGGSLGAVSTSVAATITAGSVVTTTTAGIQEAVNVLRGAGGVGGGLIRLGGGFFSITTGITIYPGIALVGQGFLSAFANIGTSAIQVPASMNTPAITVQVDPSNTSNIVFPYLADFAINGAGGSSTSQDGIYLTNTGGTIGDIYIERVGVFIVGGNGIHIANPGKHWLNEVYVEDCKQNGMLLVNDFFTRVTNSYVFGNILHGINADTAPDGALFQLSNSIISSNVLYGVNVKRTAGFVASGNYFYNNGSNTTAQVVLNGNTSVTFVGNEINDDRASGTRSQYGVNATAGASTGIVSNNSFLGAYHTAPLGVTIVCPSLSIVNNPGVNPINQMTNPFATTSIGLGGATAVPIASTDYTVSSCGIFITSANSSNANNAIVVKDGAGNTVSSPGGTMTALFVPVGFVINWGAFTGTAGAVTVWGV